MPRRLNTSGCLLLIAVSAAPGVIGGCSEQRPGAGDRAVAASHQGDETGRFPVHLNLPVGPPRVETGQRDHLDRPVTVSCVACHSLQAPDRVARSGDDLQQFHQDLQFVHGNLACLSCHNPLNYSALRLADGTEVEYASVMTLCGQCHPRQSNEYVHGAHGGMTGYWDLTRGPRSRRICIDCHDPHAPAFPHMIPTFKSRDRFLSPQSPH